MASYILSLVAASMAAAIVELLAPRGEGGRIAAQVRMVAGLFLIVALLLPLRDGVAFLADLADGDGLDVDIPSYDASAYEATLQVSLLSMGSEELAAWVRNTVAEELSISADLVEVIPVWGESGNGSETIPPPLAEVYVVLSGSAVLADPHAIEALVSEALGCPCRVSVSF